MPLHPTHWLNNVFNLFFLFVQLPFHLFFLFVVVGGVVLLVFLFFCFICFLFFLQKTGTIYKIFYDNSYTDSSLYQRLTYSQNLR